MEIDNLVANTQWLKAMEGKGKSKKYKEMLRFPHIRECAQLRNDMEAAGELTFYKIIDSLIGKKLFLTLFCATDSKLLVLSQFLTEVEKYMVAPSTEHHATATAIYDNFLKSNKISIPENIIISSVLDSINSKNTPPLLFEDCKNAVHDYLSGQPTLDFKNSHYFSRFLQWTYLSKKPVGRESFRFYRVLGKGGFGEVYACQKRDTGKLYAVKCLDKKRIKKKKSEALAWNERDLLAKINSKFVVGLKYAFETKDQLCLVLDIMNGGDLQFHLSTSKEKFTEDAIRFISAEMVLGLQHLHSQNLLYRDMKPENMLLNAEGHVCLSDLGLAVELKPPKIQVKGRVGTPGYMAPEVINGDRYGVAADWWGLGCVIYDMIAGHSPFRERGEKIRVDKLQERVLSAPIEYDMKLFTEDSKDLCSKLLERNPEKRLGGGGKDAEEVKSHPYFKSCDWIRLEARLVKPVFVPSSYQVNAKDVLDIERFDSIKGVELTADDNAVFKNFQVNVVACWEQEILDEVFDELNAFDEKNLPSDLRLDITTDQYHLEPLGFFSKLKLKLNRSKSSNAAESNGGGGSSSGSSSRTDSLSSMSSTSTSSTSNSNASLSVNSAGPARKLGPRSVSADSG